MTEHLGESDALLDKSSMLLVEHTVGWGAICSRLIAEALLPGDVVVHEAAENAGCVLPFTEEQRV